MTRVELSGTTLDAHCKRDEAGWVCPLMYEDSAGMVVSGKMIHKFNSMYKE